jgi:hypothetical protein
LIRHKRGKIPQCNFIGVDFAASDQSEGKP